MNSHEDTKARSIESDPRFALLSEADRAEVLRKLDAIRQIVIGQRTPVFIRRIAEKNKGLKGWCVPSIRRFHYLYTKTGDWTVLVNKSKLPRSK